MDDLKAKLATQEVELKQKNEDADKLIQVVGVETAKVSREKAIADEEEQRVALIMLEVQQKQRDCEEDLAKAEPALAAAQAALNTLNKVGQSRGLVCLPHLTLGSQNVIQGRPGRAERVGPQRPQLQPIHSVHKHQFKLTARESPRMSDDIPKL